MKLKSADRAQVNIKKRSARRIPQNTGQQIGFERIWEDFADITKDGTCRSFIADLIGTAQDLTGKKAHAFTVEGMLAELAKHPMYGKDGMKFYNEFGGSAGWDEATGLGYVEVGAGKLIAGSMRVGERDVARQLLHEIIHTATKGRNPFARYGGYEDVELARAIFEITGDWRDDPRDPRNNPPGSSPTSVGGVIFKRALEKYCK